VDVSAALLHVADGTSVNTSCEQWPLLSTCCRPRLLAACDRWSSNCPDLWEAADHDAGDDSGAAQAHAPSLSYQSRCLSVLVGELLTSIVTALDVASAALRREAPLSPVAHPSDSLIGVGHVVLSPSLSLCCHRCCRCHCLCRRGCRRCRVVVVVLLN
jgi:hypothetical protein